METVQIPDPSDLDNAQIVENIEIVVENGKPFYKLSQKREFQYTTRWCSPQRSQEKFWCPKQKEVPVT